MRMNERALQPNGGLTSRLPQLMMALILLQPVLDILSFWQDQIGEDNTLTLALRFGMLLAVALAGFCLSGRKRIYVALAFVLLGFGLCHAAAAIQVDLQTLPGEREATGLWMLLSDFANYVRVAQIPVFTLCFITFLKRSGEEGFAAIERSFLLVLLIVAAVEAVSVLTGTNPYTYPNKSLGILGWFYFANSQSAILSIIVPVVIMAAIRKGTSRWIRPLCVCVLGFAVLYFFGTRLSFAAIGATGVGLAFTLFVADRKKKGAIAMLLVCTAVCVGAVFQSPMYENQSRVAENAVRKQAYIDTLVAGDEAWARDYGLKGEALERQRLVGAYHFYLGGLVEKYGVSRVIDLYDGTNDVSELANVRNAKRSYCKLMLEDSPLLSHLFGLELGDMRYRTWNYDVENDFYGIYVLCGLVGLGLLGAFFLYFFLLIVKALLRNAKKYYTSEAGAWGVALVMAMMHAFATAGILRRPNASFYLSVVLAVIYYLVKLRRYEETKTQAGVFPAGKNRKDASQ